MKILFISQYFYPEPFSNNEIARSLVARGHQVEVVCSVPNYPEGSFYSGFSNALKREENWNGIRILRARTVARGSQPITLVANYLTYPFMALFEVFRRGDGPYAVSFTSMPSPIFQCIVAVAIKMIRKVPAVYWVQDIWPDSLINTLHIKNRLLTSFLRVFCSYLYRQADILLIQSEAFRPKLEAMGVCKDRIAFFPNTAPEDFAALDQADIDPAIKALFPPASLRLMFAGNIGESQNLDVIIEAAKLLRDTLDVQWVILGNGRDLDRLRDKVERDGLNDVVIFAGRHPVEHMPAFYALADAMILSLKDTEIFRMTVPYKLQSYMKAGKPVIGSISGEAKRIIDEGQIGFCADADDVAGFCAAVQSFAKLTDAGREKMRQATMEYFFAHYEPQMVYDSLEQKLQTACGKIVRFVGHTGL